MLSQLLYHLRYVDGLRNMGFEHSILSEFCSAGHKPRSLISKYSPQISPDNLPLDFPGRCLSQRVQVELVICAVRTSQTTAVICPSVTIIVLYRHESARRRQMVLDLARIVSK